MNVVNFENALIDKCIDMYQNNQNALPPLLIMPIYNYLGGNLGRFFLLSKIIDQANGYPDLDSLIVNYINSRYMTLIDSKEA